ncbi:hypothetical protein [Paraburkholderia ferrariae]|uniref:hypothetical protein n=1 Tax=Paraburkholderia ferrariae TaxID=386056 RepID=UPI0012EB728F|nr:hypothetical protein [Paraburkholderia ferrariae]
MKRRTKLILTFSIFIIAYSLVFDHTPNGVNCETSISPNSKYMAERCTLSLNTWPGDYEYVARLFDKKTGKLLAQSTFDTMETSFNWSNGLDYSDDGGKTVKHDGASVYFQRGGEEGDGSNFELPPSLWDRLLAMRPRLPWNR